MIGLLDFFWGPYIQFKDCACGTSQSTAYQMFLRCFSKLSFHEKKSYKKNSMQTYTDVLVLNLNFNSFLLEIELCYVNVPYGNVV